MSTACFQTRQDLYQHPLMLRQAVAERAVISTRLRACAGAHGLQLTAFAADAAPVLPLLPHWVQLQVSASGYTGDLQLSRAVPLPFVDESFDVIWLKHALDVHAQPAALLAMAIRLLAPGGSLLISGLHPLSGWAPWSLRGQRHGGRLQLPWLLHLALQLSGLPLQGQWRQGSCWPRAGADLQRRNRLGGVYMLLARKERAQILPFVSRLAAQRRLPTESLGAVQVRVRPGQCKLRMDEGGAGALQDDPAGRPSTFLGS